MGTGDKNNENKLAAYIGISGPDTPKYLLANNFLAEFFRDDAQDYEKQYTYEDFLKKKIILCEEDDERKKEQLEESFNNFFRRFSGDALIVSKNRHYYFPLKPQMLRSSKTNLRHLLYCMIPGIENEDVYHDVQMRLYKYLYSGADGVSYLMSVICEEKNFDESRWLRLNKRNHEFEMLKEGNFKKICENFKEDLFRLLGHPFFIRLDFYKRYDYLATLLNFYVVQFIINKKTVGVNKGYVLCQGSSHLAKCEAYHRACVQNYAEIRFVFQTELKQFYIECLAEKQSDNHVCVVNEKDNIFVKIKENEQVEFIKFVRTVFHSSFNEEAKLSFYPSIRKVFALEGISDKTYSVEEFVMYYIDFSSARKGSTLTKISSALNTCGKDISFVFPKTRSKHKYFALSPLLLDFFVRLYLAKEMSSYAYLDNFLSFLQERYGICIQKNERMDKILKNLHVKVPFQEFRENERALIENLDEINCLIRLSDSGYVITLPEEKGEFILL